MSTLHPATCTKCRRSISAEDWAAMEYVGIQSAPADLDDPVGLPAFDLEMRNCGCGTTLSALLTVQVAA